MRTSKHPTRAHNHDADQTSAPSQFDDSLPSIVQIQRKLLAFFYIYATLIVSLYLTYAVYCYFQHTSVGQQRQEAPVASKQSARLADAGESLEQKMHLLERYIEMIALDLDETKARLREREKCACSLKCHFNGTTFDDGQSWQRKCDVCACGAGKISCAPRPCPKLSCDSPVQSAGQCCPTCKKGCTLNKTLIKHGAAVKLGDANSRQKQCMCNDGLIRCEPVPAASVQSGSQASRATDTKAQNKTIQYLKSIIASPQLVKLRAS